MEFDPVEEFSSWLGKKVGGKNENLQSFTMIISTFAVLEFAQNVLNVGSGFTKMDLSGITLMQIKETVKRIEGKVDKMLEAPLKKAKMHCEAQALLLNRQKKHLVLLVQSSMKQHMHTLCSIIRIFLSKILTALCKQFNSLYLLKLQEQAIMRKEIVFFRSVC